MVNFVEFIVKHLVEYPDQVEVSEVSSGDRVSYLLKEADEDLGRIIGKKGRTVQSLRTLVTAAHRKQGKHVSLELDMPNSAAESR